MLLSINIAIFNRAVCVAMHIFDTTYLVLIILPFLMFSVFYSSVIDLSTIEQFIAALISSVAVFRSVSGSRIRLVTCACVEPRGKTVVFNFLLNLQKNAYCSTNQVQILFNLSIKSFTNPLFDIQRW